MGKENIHPDLLADCALALSLTSSKQSSLTSECEEGSAVYEMAEALTLAVREIKHHPLCGEERVPFEEVDEDLDFDDDYGVGLTLRALSRDSLSD